MSLFYGYRSKEEELEERMKKLEIQLPFHKHNIVFDFNVTRASKNVTFWISKPDLISVIADKEGKSKQISVLFWYGIANGPILNTSGKHYFISPKNGENVTMFANCPLLRFPDVSISVVLKRNSVKPKANVDELIFYNGKRGLGYIAGVKNGIYIINHDKKHTAHPSTDLSKKHVLTVYWRSQYGQSHLFVNNSMKKTFMGSIVKDDDANAYVFGSSVKDNIFSDVSIYGIKVFEGFLTKSELYQHTIAIMKEYDIPL